MAAAKKKRAVKETVALPPQPTGTVHIPPTSQASKFIFPIVGIGASAGGGLEAMEEFFKNTPPDTGMAFVVVTHQLPGRTSMLPELLRRDTKLPVVEAEDGMKLEPNHVYIGQPGGHLTISDGRLERLETEHKEAPRLPIDHFFRSLALDQKEHAICIVLSGTGTDGTLGLRAIKAEAGMAMVQQPQSAQYNGMPSSAIATGLTDYVLPSSGMPKQLIAYAKGPYLKLAAIPEMTTVDVVPMNKIFALLRNRTGNDFSAYKNSTIRRRIERRMNVHQIKGPEEYIRYLQENPHEIDVLFKELLISVTSFFRDLEAWEALNAHLQTLLKSRPENYTLRVWVPGCATGEEAYSLAIALRECMDRLSRHPTLQIFGTDLDDEAIETARSGQYSDGIVVDVSPKRLERYFIHDDGYYRVCKEIREMVIFAAQNVIKHPPFTKLDILSCRNLLIYLNADLQKSLLPIFHYALKPGGLMFMGPSETIGSFGDLFEPLDKRWRIYRRKESPGGLHALPDMPAQQYKGDEGLTAPAAPERSPREAHTTTLIQNLLLRRFVPASVIVNERGDIFFLHGRTGAYLEPAPGEPRNNLLDMAREGLQIELPAAIRECVRKGVDVRRENIRVKTNGDYTDVNLLVSKIKEPESVRGLLMVTFRPTPPTPGQQPKAKRAPKTAGDKDRVKRLEQELRYLKESHQTTQEELESSNEELKSTNEELQSTNEELQSANEELETSREEMQSLNEELTTVNAELHSKLDELSETNNDMQNLLNSTDIATVFLDNQLNIKRFTEKATELIKLRPSDAGRPISELTSNLEFNDLMAECREVLRTLIPRESEVLAHDGKWYLKRIMPYRTAENAIDGVVLTFVNIVQLREAGERARAFFAAIVDTVRQPLVVLDKDLRVFSANRSFYQTFHTAAKQTEGRLIYELGAGEWDIVKLRQLLEDILPKNTKFQDYEVNVEFPQIGRRVFLLNGRRLEQPPGTEELILLSLEEMTSK